MSAQIVTHGARQPIAPTDVWNDDRHSKPGGADIPTLNAAGFLRGAPAVPGQLWERVADGALDAHVQATLERKASLWDRVTASGEAAR